METKRLELHLKADTPGSVEAVFATLNVIDKDGDVTRPGAFTNGAPVNIAAWGHNWGDLPSGDGRIYERSNEAVFDGAFYLGTPQGDATHETLKQRFDRGVVTQEWSYSYQPLEYSFGTFEGQQVRFLDKLAVFEVSPVMLGAGENTRTTGIKGLKFPDQIEAVQAAVGDVVARAEDLASLRMSEGKEGRVFSAANRARLASLVDAIAAAREELAALLEDTDPEKGRHELERIYLSLLHSDIGASK